MRFSIATTALFITAGICHAFAPLNTMPAVTSTSRTSSMSLSAIREKKDKSQELRFGWDGTTALGESFRITSYCVLNIAS
jgi:hypothetical protein